MKPSTAKARLRPPIIEFHERIIRRRRLNDLIGHVLLFIFLGLCAFITGLIISMWTS